MSISQDTAAIIHELLMRVVREKLKKYRPETKHMPFPRLAGLS